MGAGHQSTVSLWPRQVADKLSIADYMACEGALGSRHRLPTHTHHQLIIGMPGTACIELFVRQNKAKSTHPYGPRTRKNKSIAIQ